jgi:hypothetical protein
VTGAESGLSGGVSARGKEVFPAGGAAAPESGEFELLDGAAAAGGFTAFERTLSNDEFPVELPPGAESGATSEPAVAFAERLFGSGGRNWMADMTGPCVTRGS